MRNSSRKPRRRRSGLQAGPLWLLVRRIAGAPWLWTGRIAVTNSRHLSVGVPVVDGQGWVAVVGGVALVVMRRRVHR
jgi:hypothetical protein